MNSGLLSAHLRQAIGSPTSSESSVIRDESHVLPGVVHEAGGAVNDFERVTSWVKFAFQAA